MGGGGFEKSRTRNANAGYIVVSFLHLVFLRGVVLVGKNEVLRTVVMGRRRNGERRTKTNFDIFKRKKEKREYLGENEIDEKD